MTLKNNLRAGVHLGAAAPLVWLFWAIPAGRLGGDPVEELTHFLGMGALRLLLLTLCLTPLAKNLRLPGIKSSDLMRLRRPLGLWCFAWASLHFAVWLSLDLQFLWSFIGAEIIERKYLLVGFSAWLILLALAITSLPKLQRAMGASWKKLHRLIYLVAILVPLHFLWSVKSGLFEPGLYIVITACLLWFRRKLFIRRTP